MLLGFAASSRTLGQALLFIYKLVMHHTLKNQILLIFIWISYSGFSQDSRLFEQNWYLHDLIIDGQSNVPPINNELSYILLEFNEPDEFHTVVCDGTNGFATLNFNGTTEFSFSSPIVWLAGSCSLFENIMYTNLYQDGFWYNTSLSLVQYEIIENGQGRMLTVTASNGDQAIYSENLLITFEFENSFFRIFPNPVDNIIYLEYADNIFVNRIRIYDINGRQVLLEEKAFSQIDVSNLKSSVYFISIENNDNKVLVKKFIKE
jgi:hypothetical protein